MAKYICEKVKECTDENCADREPHEHNKWCECGCDLQLSQFPGVKCIILKPSEIELIAEERQRQIEKEGWTAEHDDEHLDYNLSSAGAIYALSLLPLRHHRFDELIKKVYLYCWPWDDEWWKPTPDDPIRQLTKAGALIAAEIDRLQRNSK